MSISHLASNIAESPTLELNEKAQRMRDLGIPVINFSIGQPVFPIPFDAVVTAAAKLCSARVGYTPSDGTKEMKQAVIRYMADHYEKEVSHHNVVVTAGAKMAIYEVLLSILDPQDEVILLAPYWVSYPEMVKLCYGVPRVVHPEDGTFEPAFEEIEEAVTSQTKAIILNSPNNPSGAVYSEELVRKVVEFCEERGIYVICDDIYHRLVFDRVVVPNPYKFAKSDVDESKVVVVNGISKLYAMTGVRIGWAVGPTRLMQVMTNIQAQTVSCPSALQQAAAVGALTGVQSQVESLRLKLQNNRDVMVRELRTIEDVRVIEPKGTFYCLADFRAYSDDSVALCKHLLDKAYVAAVPGKEFGAEGFIRLSFTGTVNEILEGVARIRWAVDPSSPREIYIGERKIIREATF